jgi:AcrR family transcriptional regulator
MGRPAARDARDTRQHILDAALDLFAEKGFFGTSMRELARAVGVRESAIYHHFASKDALLDALMIDAGQEKVNLFDRTMERLRGLPVRDLLTQLARTMVESWEEPREQRLWRIMCIEGFRLSECGRFELDAAFRSARSRLETLFAGLAAEGKIKPVEPKLAAMEFMAPMFMVRNMAASPKSYKLPEGVTARHILEAHVGFFCDALCS